MRLSSPDTRLNIATFNGRSWDYAPLRYSLRERLVVLFAMRLMPLVSRLLISNRLNTLVWRLLGCRIGRRSLIRVGTRINAPFKLEVGEDCFIHGTLLTRGGVSIGNGVEFVEEVFVSTQAHNIESPDFESVYKPVRIDDHAWLGPRTMVLSGVHISVGTAVAAGAVVAKSTEPWGLYAGVPAKLLKKRAVLRLP